MIVVIDGPAGAGKSSAAKALAARLGVRFLDTGAMYRAFTLRALRLGVLHAGGPAGRLLHVDDPKALARVVDDGRLEMPLGADGRPRVLLDGEDVTDAIRSAEVTRSVSRLAEEPSVRQRLVAQQRELARKFGSIVGEGRDLGTVVFPDATVKIYLDASADVRTARRRAELGPKAPAHEDLKRQIEERDHRDATRAVAPLSKAEDAVVIDTSDMTLEQVVGKIDEIVRGATTRRRGPGARAR